MLFKRFVPLAVLLIAFHLSLFAQLPAVGLRVGPACVSLIGDSDELSAATRYYFGFDALLPLGEGRFSIQPELNFVGQGGQVKGEIGGSKARTNLILNYIQLAGLARFGILEPAPFGVSAFGGVTLDLGIGTKTRYTVAGEKISSDRESFGDANLNAFNVGIAVGGEATYTINEIFEVFAQLRYGIGLLDIAKSENFTTRTSNLAFLLGGRVNLGEL